MKRIYLLFLILCLWAIPIKAQRIVIISGGVVTANVDDFNDFLINLNQNVTGVTLSMPTFTQATGYQITMRFVQDATGSRTVTFGGNITSTCTINATANSTTICRWQYTASGNTWADAGGGGGGITLPNYVNEFTYGVKRDGHYSGSAVFTNGSNVITCPDCNFTGTDILGRPVAKVNQVVFGSNVTTDVTQINSTITLAETTILSIDSATQIHTTGNVNCGGACGATSFLAWGDLDSNTAAGGSQTSVNDPAFGAWTAAAANCVPLVKNAGVSLIERGEWNTYTSNCGNQNQIEVSRQGFTILGQGSNATIDIVTPSFPSTDCTGPNGAGIGCLMSLINPVLKDFQIWGLGNSDPGAGFNGKSAVYIVGASPGSNFEMSRVSLFGWGANRAGFNGLNIGNGVAAAISGGTMDQVNVEAFGGGDTCHIDPGSFGAAQSVINATHLWCTVNGKGNALWINNVNFSSTAGLYGWTTGTLAENPDVGMAVSINTTGHFRGVNDEMPYTSTGPEIHLNGVSGGGSFDEVNGLISNSRPGTAIQITTSGKVSLQNTTVNGSFDFVTDASCTAANCQFFDLGNENNKITGSTQILLFSSSAGMYVPFSSVAGACTGTATSSSTIGLRVSGSSTTGTAVVTACTNTAVIDAGKIMDHAGTLMILTVTDTHVGVNASSGVVTVLKNGGATTLTCTLGTAAHCEDGTHSVAFTNGDLISLQFTTQATEVLAGVQATVSAY